MDDVDRFARECMSPAKRIAGTFALPRTMQIEPRLVLGWMLSLLKRIKALLPRDDDEPEDPYAYVTAPVKPRPPVLRAGAKAQWPID